MKENPLQYRVRGTPVPTTQTRGTNYPKSTMPRKFDQDAKDRVVRLVEDRILAESMSMHPAC